MVSDYANDTEVKHTKLRKLIKKWKTPLILFFQVVSYWGIILKNLSIKG